MLCDDMTMASVSSVVIMFPPAKSWEAGLSFSLDTDTSQLGGAVREGTLSQSSHFETYNSQLSIIMGGTLS